MKNFQVSIYSNLWSVTLIAISLANTAKAATLLTEDAESESPAVNSQTATGYDAIQSEIAPEGSNAFHLTHTDSDQGDQFIQLSSSFTPGSSTYLFFESKMGWSSSTQVANVEVSSDNGANWTNIWNKNGADNSGDGSFTLQSVSMAAFAGTSLQLRFRYTFSSGSYYPGTGTNLGWIFDNIQIGDTLATREWSIGTPTAKEQNVIELVNRARSDSQADLQRLVKTTDSDVTYAYEYFNVDLDVLAAQFSGTQFGPGAQAAGSDTAIPSTLPPLAPNTKLTTAARLHTEDMLNNEFQGHDSSSGAISPNQSGDKVGDRINRQGYDYSTVAENVSSYSESIWDSHAAFIVDWGTSASTGLTYAGMQDPSGHRTNVYRNNIREIGVGVVEGTNGSVGPLLVTHALATESNYDQPFITGVAYYDTDGNGFYDEGEGIGGITINVDDSPYHAVTPDSGGYAIPVTNDGAYSLSYTMPDGSTGSQSANVSNQENIKTDISPDWSATEVIGLQTYQTNVEVSYSVAPVPAATAYRLWLWEIVSWPGDLGAEDSRNIKTTTTGSYSSIQDTVKATGTKAYRLASTDATDQTLEIDYDILPGSNSILSWQDQLGIIATGQEALVQISTDSGSNWTTLETRNGTGASGYATEFSSRNVSLRNYEGQPVRIRFQIHNPPSIEYIYSQTSEAFGWYLDDISLGDSEIIKDGVSSEGPGYEWAFTTPEAASFLLRAQIINNTNEYPLGPILRIKSVNDTSPSTNQPPLAIELSQVAINESIKESEIIATITVTDPDTEDSHVFALVPGEGDTDNTLFMVSGNKLKTLQTFDYETKSNYAILIQVKDEAGNTLEQAFTITITDDSSEDKDGDGLTELEEESIGTSDLLADTDNDGTSDFDEVNAGSDPTDNSSTPDIAEVATGTGFFVTENGYIVTNHHVVQNAIRIEVSLEGTYYEAQLITYSADNDLALLKVTGQFQALPMVTAENVSLGTDVFTIGYPWTSGNSKTYTEGVINALEPWGDQRIFQISAQLHAGNSGGALIDKNNGNVVGIVSSKLVGVEIQDVNYAVKSQYALEMLTSVTTVTDKLMNPFPVDTLRDENEIKSEVENSTVRVISYLNQTAVDNYSNVYSWNLATDIGGGWNYFDWFSYYWDSGSNWIYQINLGWLYRLSESTNSIWFWDESLGWLWTNSTNYPNFYQSNSRSWLYYHEGSNSPRYFYKQSTETWGEY